ncbi:MAG: hypothetical protein ACE5KT_01720 [Methanosarcinales archaeon]
MAKEKLIYNTAYTPGSLHDIIDILEQYYLGKMSLGLAREKTNLSINEFWNVLESLHLFPIYSEEDMIKGLKIIKELKEIYR